MDFDDLLECIYEEYYDDDKVDYVIRYLHQVEDDGKCDELMEKINNLDCSNDISGIYDYINETLLK